MMVARAVSELVHMTPAPAQSRTRGEMTAPRTAAALLTLLIYSLCCAGQEEAASPTVIVLDVSGKHAEKVAMDIEPFLGPGDVIARMSVRQTGGPAATRRRLERMMRWNDAALAMPYAVFAPRNETEKAEGLEQARTLSENSTDKLLCEIVPQDPELQSRTYMSAGNYHTINWFVQMCDLAFGIRVHRINLVGSCVLDQVRHRRYMRIESGVEEFDAVQDPDRPRPDVLLCVPSAQTADGIDTSPAAVLAAAHHTRSTSGIVDCARLWEGGRPALAVSSMMHPLCRGESHSPARVTVIDEQ